MSVAAIACRWPVAREQQIRQRAHEYYIQSGRQSGRALDDWLRAEQEVCAAEDRVIDEASEESFPASDPPAYNA